MSIAEAQEGGNKREYYQELGRAEASLPPGTNDIGYPRKFFSRPDAEKRKNARLGLAAGMASDLSSDAGIMYGQVTDEDVNFQLTRENEVDLINFEQWLSQLFDPNDPNLSRLLGSMYPEYFDRRMEVIEEKIEMQKRLARLTLLGPQNRDDLWLLYNINQGRVPIDETAAFIPPTEDKRGDYRRGMFNFKQLASPDTIFNISNSSVKDPAFKGWKGNTMKVKSVFGKMKTLDNGDATKFSEAFTGSKLGLPYLYRFPFGFPSSESGTTFLGSKSYSEGVQPQPGKF
jgi:hypothetical protein